MICKRGKARFASRGRLFDGNASDALSGGDYIMPIKRKQHLCQYNPPAGSRANIMSRSLFSIVLLVIISLGGVQSQSLETAGGGFDDEHGAESRVFGGKDAKFQRYPYMAHVYNKDGRPYCAGTLITPTYILSAAHCADDDSTPAYVIIGKHSRLSYQNESGVERIDVKKVILHPDHAKGFDWINNHLKHDIVLLQLKADSRHPPALVNTDPNLLTETNGLGTGLRVMGWGTTTYAKTRPDELQIANVDYVPNSECARSSGLIRPTSTVKRSYKGLITDDMICAASKEKDACSGDSGEFKDR